MASFCLSTTYTFVQRPRNTKPITRINKKPLIHCAHKQLEVLYDDGYLTPKGIKEYHDAVFESLRFNEGPPRWFCPVDCGPPIEGSPLMLFLPGVDGIGMGLFMHHKALRGIFEVRCMHVPFSDRTSFEGLLAFVEDAVKHEHSKCHNKPIYLLGHSFGGCVALSIAARNPNIDLVLIITNPGTSFGKSKLQGLFPVIRSSFGHLNSAIPLFLLLCFDHLVKRGLEPTGGLNLLESPSDISKDLVSPLINLSNLMGNIPNETVLWKLELLKSAASHSNSRLHAVKAEVLVIASCMDSFLPSRDEGGKLAKILLKCKVYYFEKFGHNILMENGFHLCSIIKGSGSYRKSRRQDHIKDFLPPTITELREANKMLEFVLLSSSPTAYSTLDDGRIVKGLSGVPNDGPVLLVGNHMLCGFDMMPLFADFIREKRIVLRGLGHPILFVDRKECPFEGHHFYDFVRIFGGVPVTFKNFYRLLSEEKAFVLLYPGGSREALHRKGEQYKLFWPDQPEFVRMAAKFGAKIVPFGSVGEDDVGEMFIDYNEIMSIPCIRDRIIEVNRDTKIRNNHFGIRTEDLLMPMVWPKIPGRYYYLFGKPISMSSKTEILLDTEAANAMYLHIKSEVESIVSYLLKKREEDPYRSIVIRTLSGVIFRDLHEVPSFEP